MKGELITVSNKGHYYKFIEKEDRLIAKRYLGNSFLKSYIVPTCMFPLHDDKNFKVFTYDNTEVITDKKILDIIDSCPYEPNRCYTNTERLLERLLAGGINAKPYVGWIFCHDGSLPVHHCVTVIDDIHIIDLADDEPLFWWNMNKRAEEENIDIEHLTMDEYRDYKLDWIRYIKTHQIKNTQRIVPVGKLHLEKTLFIGCECIPDIGRKEFNDLWDRYPNHESYTNCDRATGHSKLTMMFEENGLITKR